MISFHQKLVRLGSAVEDVYSHPETTTKCSTPKINITPTTTNPTMTGPRSDSIYSTKLFPSCKVKHLLFHQKTRISINKRKSKHGFTGGIFL